MLFNSVQFAIFFIIVYAHYIALNHKWQNRMLLLASYVFYGAWDWRFLFLLFFTISVDYFMSLLMCRSKNEGRKKWFLFISIFTNLAVLGFFKYFGFFTESLAALLSQFGLSIHPTILHIVLPVGISFYTFQSMSYIIDVYRGALKPPEKFSDFALFVAFFPQLVAGPIERATHLLPQILNPRKITLTQFYDGCYLIFWGLFQKIVIADNLVKVVDPVFSSSGPYNGSMVLLALYAFAFQIFCDFAGYSNIARGLAKVMGFELMVNFNLPYFSTNPSEFWRRWHISLSTWLRDYLYIPLGGNRKGELATYRNLAITMLLGGLWHGANWTFVIWGAYQGFLLIVYKLAKPLADKIPELRSPIGQDFWFIFRVVFFFHLVCLGWLFFRAQSLGQAGLMLESLFLNFQITPEFSKTLLYIMYFTFFLIVLQIIKYRKNDGMIVMKWPAVEKTIFVLMTLYMIFFVELLARSANIGGGSEFIYFQF